MADPRGIPPTASEQAEWRHREQQRQLPGEYDAGRLVGGPQEAPSAPAEPLREQVRRSLHDILSLVKQGPGGRNVWLLPYEAEAILAALSVSTSETK